MIKVSVKIDNTALNAKLRRQQRELALLPDQGLTEFQRLTPRKTGNARARTDLTNNNTIVGNYPYAQRLEGGWSRQAPKGMIRPFTLWWNKQIRRIFRK